MTDSPVFCSPEELRLWKHASGSKAYIIQDFVMRPDEYLYGSIKSREGSVNSNILVKVMERFEYSREQLADIVSKSRVPDCRPSVKAAEILISREDYEGAFALLAMSERSGEVFHRSLTEARIKLSLGDLAGAKEAAIKSYNIEPTSEEVQEILDDADPSGGWRVRQAIALIVNGSKAPEIHPSGRMGELYGIYLEWFFGSRDKASHSLIESHYYKEGDPEFKLVSARMSVSEKDWTSAVRVYKEILDNAPVHLKQEAAEAMMGAGDTEGALEALHGISSLSRRAARDKIAIYSTLGRREGLLESIRTYLDSEFSSRDDYIGLVDLLISASMNNEAEELLQPVLLTYPRDSGALTRSSLLKAARGDTQGSLADVTKARASNWKDPDALAQLARTRRQAGRDKSAEALCDRIISSHPDHIGALRVKAEMLVSRGDRTAAIDVYTRLLEVDPEDIDSMKAMADLEAESGDMMEAQNLLDSAYRLDKGRDNALDVAGRMVALGLNRDAIRLCKDLERSYPADGRIRLVAGNAHYAMGDYMQASISYASAAEADPSDPVIWHSKGMADEIRGDTESAIESYERALSLDPKSAEYWISLSRMQEASGDLDSAVNSLNRAIAVDTDSVYALVRKSMILASLDRYDEAESIMEIAAATSDDPRIVAARIMMLVRAGRKAEAMALADTMTDMSNPEVAMSVAECCMESEDPSRAIVALDAALSKDPSNMELLKLKVSALTDAGRTNEAESVVRAMRNLHPDDPAPFASASIPAHKSEPVEEAPAESESKEEPEALAQMAVSLDSAGDRRGALRAIDRALEIDPYNPDNNCIKARIMLSSGDPNHALDLAQPLLSANPDHAGLHEVVGDALLETKNRRAAIMEYSTALGCGGPNVRILVKRADAYLAMGDVDSALKDMHKAQAESPDDPDINAHLASLLMEAGDQSALKFMRRSLDSRCDAASVITYAEMCSNLGDREGLREAMSLFKSLPSPGADSTVRMVKLMEVAGLEDDAMALMGRGPKAETADVTVKRNAEKALRRAYTMKSDPTDPDIMAFLGLDDSMASRVISYISERHEYGRITPGTEEFKRMEAVSHDVVMKLGWTNLESDSKLPLEKVFAKCGFRDADEAKEAVAYIFKAMRVDVGRSTDPKLSSLSMGLPKGMTVYDVMKDCGLGVYEARAVLGLVV